MKKMMSLIKIKYVVMTVVILFSVIPHTAFGQIRFRLKPYIGIGLGIGSQSGIPLFEIEEGNESDQDYYDYNLASLSSTSFRFQTRLGLLQWGHLSLGYLFWNHSYQYSQYFPENVVILNRNFPHSYYFSVHGATLQWDFYRSSSAKIIPFIAGGVGQYHGSFKNFYYWVEDEFDVTAEKTVSQIISYEGTAAFAGVGVTVFKYGYVYVGYFDLIKETLPARQFIDVIIGVTF